jgi:hypothetical protein
LARNAFSEGGGNANRAKEARMIALLWKKLRWRKNPSWALTIAVFTLSLAAATHAREAPTWPESIIAFGVAVFMLLWSMKRVCLLHSEFYGKDPRYILRAKPGPGIDFVIWPAELGDRNHQWWVDGRTEAGNNFVHELGHHPLQPLSNRELAEMKEKATRWGLTFETRARPPIPLEPKAAIEGKAEQKRHA